MLVRERFLAGDSVENEVRPVVLESWRRSVAYGVHPRALRRQEADPERLAEARRWNDELIRSAEPFLQTMHETLGSQQHLVALSDQEGLILLAYVSQDLPRAALEEANLFEGASWHERDLGSNGIGTALAAGEPVLLVGPEHFQEAYVGWTCVGVPIRGESGAVVGAIDLSVPNAATHPHAWGWTISVARAIEAVLARPVASSRVAAGAEVDARGPLQSVRGVLEGLVSGLDLPAAHSGFLEEARAELERADAAELVRTNRLLLRDRELLERLIDEIPVMVVIYDPEVQHVRVNRHLERVLGWTNEDVDRWDLMELCYPDPDCRDQVRAFMDSLAPGWRDFDVAAKDGSTVRSSWANIRLTDDRRVGIGVDITARKEAEDQVRRALEEARRALRERDSILAVVSHDLRNPLSTLVMASSLLLEDISEEKKQAQVAIIRRGVDQMQRLIQDLLDAARIDAGGLTVERRPCECDELVFAATQSHAPLARAQSVTLVTGDVPRATVDADFDRVLQVFGNLLSNAIEHTPEGGRIVVDAATAADHVVFSVRDTGTGIPPEDLHRIFDRFWQAEKTQRAGAGLGLAIAKGIVEAHGGTIRAESDPGRGSTFSFSLPLARER